jgi:ABC-type Zn2+ transport system substrate-binding protein/surface adhesin
MQLGRPSLQGGQVPVTAKLSKRCYEVLGEDVATELVDWFNAVDATYRADLRELNELNFARFDAKLEQRLAALDAKWHARWVELDAKWSERWSALDTKLEQRLAALDAKLEQRVAALRADLVKWMFAFWVPTAVALFATGFGVVTLVLRR